MNRARASVFVLLGAWGWGCGTAPSPAVPVQASGSPRPTAPKPQVEKPGAVASSPAPPKLELDACGCPKSAPPAGVSLWRRQLEKPLAGCSGSFSERNEIELDCYTNAREQRQLHFDTFGRRLAEKPASSGANAVLAHALADPKTWGKPGRGDYGTGYLALSDGGGVVWASAQDDTEAAQIVRVDSSGKKLWSRAAQGMYVLGISDGQGGVIVGGMIADRCTFPDQPGAFAQQVIVSRLSATGELSWTQRLACSTQIRSIRLPAPDEVAVMGSFSPRSDDDSEWGSTTWVTQLSLRGEQLYTRTAEGSLMRSCACTFQLLVSESEQDPPSVELRALP